MVTETVRMQAMTAAGGLVVDLDDAIAALTSLDGDRLEEIEGRISAAMDSVGLLALTPAEGAPGRDEMAALRSRCRVLGLLIENTGRNLKVLYRLHRRAANGGDVWAL